MTGHVPALDPGCQPPASGGNSRRVESQVRELLGPLGMLDVAIGNAQPLDVRRRDAGVGRRFAHRAAEAAHQRALLDGEHQRAGRQGPEHDLGIERFDEAGR